MMIKNGYLYKNNDYYIYNVNIIILYLILSTTTNSLLAEDLNVKPLWWLSDKESACQCRRHGFAPWSGKIPHAVE